MNITLVILSLVPVSYEKVSVYRCIIKIEIDIVRKVFFCNSVVTVLCGC